jgi:hypothetical protein
LPVGHELAGGREALALSGAHGIPRCLAPGAGPGAAVTTAAGPFERGELGIAVVVFDSLAIWTIRDMLK